MKLEFKFNKKYGYFFYQDYGYEICIEPCLNGFDIGLYKDRVIVDPKICTDMNGEADQGLVEAYHKVIKKKYQTLLKLAKKDREYKKKIAMHKLKWSDEPQIIFKREAFQPY